MAESDWAFLNNGLAASIVARGVSNGFTPPNGGGSFVYGFHGLAATSGAVGLYPVDSNFAPCAKGGSIRAALQRAGGDAGATVLIAAALEDYDVTAGGYLLGFAEDEEPGHLILRKGSIQGGIQETSAYNLRKSSATYAKGSWAHVRLDVIVQPHGDVLLQVFENDLALHPVTSPTWQAIPGMAEFVDDVIGVNSGSLPYNGGGYFAQAYRNISIGRYGLIDHIEIARQL